jgi:hypothetical protein
MDGRIPLRTQVTLAYRSSALGEIVDETSPKKAKTIE